MLIDCWCNIIVLNAYAQTEEKGDKSKENFHKQIQQVFECFPKHHMKILLGDFNANFQTYNWGLEFT